MYEDDDIGQHIGVIAASALRYFIKEETRHSVADLLWHPSCFVSGSDLRHQLFGVDYRMVHPAESRNHWNCECFGTAWYRTFAWTKIFFVWVVDWGDSCVIYYISLLCLEGIAILK